MNRSIIISLLLMSLLLISSSTYSQAFGYSSDAQLIRKEGNTIIVESSGTYENKKDATNQAVKSAIRTLLISGIDGVNNGSPLIPTSKQENANVQKYINELLDGGRYGIFVKGYSEVKERSKSVGKMYQSVVQVTIYDEGLYKDMVKNQIIPESGSKMNMGDIEDQLAQTPSIMVVPYRKDGKDYEKLLNDKNVRMAITAVDQEFINLGVSTKSYETVLSRISSSNLLNSAISLEDMLLSQSGADVYVTVDLEMDSNSSGTVVSLSLRGAETGTGRNLAAQQLHSARFNTTNISSICTALCKSAMGDFLKQITAGFGKKVSAGLSMSMEITMSPNSSIDLNERVGSKNMPIKLLIKQYVRDNSKDSKYEITGETSTRVQFDRIFVNGRLDEFSDNFCMFLFDNNVSHKSSFIDNVLRIVID